MLVVFVYFLPIDFSYTSGTKVSQRFLHRTKETLAGSPVAHCRAAASGRLLALQFHFQVGGTVWHNIAADGTAAAAAAGVRVFLASRRLLLARRSSRFPQLTQSVHATLVVVGYQAAQPSDHHYHSGCYCPHLLRPILQSRQRMYRNAVEAIVQQPAVLRRYSPLEEVR